MSDAPKVETWESDGQEWISVPLVDAHLVWRVQRLPGEGSLIERCALFVGNHKMTDDTGLVFSAKPFKEAEERALGALHDDGKSEP